MSWTRVINPCSSCSRVLVAGLRHNNDKPSPLQTLITTSVSKNCNVGIYTIYLRVSKETRHKHPRLRARLIQLCFGMLRPGIMSSIWYLLPSSKGTQWGECAGAVSVPQWPKMFRCPSVFLLLACCAHHYSGLVKRWISGGKFINQNPQVGCCMNFTSDVWDQSTLPISKPSIYLQKSFSKTGNK